VCSFVFCVSFDRCVILCDGARASLWPTLVYTHIFCVIVLFVCYVLL
jgi:hypothetical protein